MIKILKEEKGDNRIEMTFGSSIVAFGPGKLKILDIINHSLNFVDETTIMDVICEEKMTEILFVFLFDFSQNL